MIQKSRKLRDPGTEMEQRAAETATRFPKIPALDLDPQSPVEGISWVRRGSPPKLCVVVDGVIRTVNLT